MREILSIAKALGDESRLRALLAVKDGELCLCQIIQVLDLSPATVSKHMDVLERAGLVQRRRQGKWRYYRLGAAATPPAARGVLCTRNACRSQMAEGWTRALHAGRLDPCSAGTAPGTLDPRAIQVMREAGIDLAAQRPKGLEELRGIDFDWVITVCDRAAAACPVFPGPVRRLHAGFDDPPALAANAATEDERLAHYRRVRDEIRAFVDALPAALSTESILRGAR
jgi:arsenate reductase